MNPDRSCNRPEWIHNIFIREVRYYQVGRLEFIPHIASTILCAYFMLCLAPSQSLWSVGVSAAHRWEGGVVWRCGFHSWLCHLTSRRHTSQITSLCLSFLSRGGDITWPRDYLKGFLWEQKRISRKTQGSQCRIQAILSHEVQKKLMAHSTCGQLNQNLR